MRARSDDSAAWSDPDGSAEPDVLTSAPDAAVAAAASAAPAPVPPAVASGVAAGSGQPRDSRFADLRRRIASALVLAPIGLGALWQGGFAWWVLIVAASLGLALEWRGLCRRFGADGAARSGVAACGMAAIALAAAALIWLRADAEAGRDNVLFVVLTVWATDIGAYAAGRAVGGRKLSPSISPAKTWAGAAGGLAAATAAGALAGALLRSVPAGVAFGPPSAAALLGIAAQLGDLAESAAKRAAGVKDSGWLIPGHGGLLDRLDGMIAASLAAALLAIWAGRGVVFWR